MGERTILHVDMDAFFASVEVLDDPRLRGRPVIVGGTPEGRGVVSAACYEARKYGVRSAMSAARARQLCPHGVFLRGNGRRYAEVSGWIFDVFRAFSPLVEGLSVDEAFLDLTGTERLYGGGEAAAVAVKRRILEEIGLVASVGVAPNKFLAKLASDLEKPDGLVVVPRDDVQGFLDPLDVGRLWGVGPKSQQVLGGLGIRTVADLRAADPLRLEARLGPAQAEHVGRLARGLDERPVVPDHEAKSVGNEVTFPEDIGDAVELHDVLDQLSHKVARRLRQCGKRCRTVQLKARFPDFSTFTRAETLPTPTDSTRVLRDTARHLLDTHLDRRGRPLRLVGVSAQNLVAGEEPAPLLFPDSDAERDRELDQIMDRAADRFGKGALTRGLQQKKPGSREGFE